MTGGYEAAGDIATGALLARTVEPHGGGSGGEASGGGHPALCLNCGTALIGEFCHRCGQVGHVHRTLASIGHDLLHGVWHFEGKIWSTLPMLFTRPGQLTRRYIAGERVRFVSPLALFLFSVFLMVATFSTIGGPLGSDNVEVSRNGRALSLPEVKKTLEQQKLALAKARAEREMLKASKAGLDAIDKRIETIEEEVDDLQKAYDLFSGAAINVKKADIDTGWPWLDDRLLHMVKEPNLYLYKLQSNAYKYSWALIPISLPFIWLLFAFRRDVGPYDHSIFAIYSLSAMTMGAVLLSVGKAIGLPGGMIATVLTLGPPLHMYKQLRGAYGVSRFGAIWRTIALLIFAGIAGLIFFALIFGMIA